MQRLADGLVNRVPIQAQHGAKPCGYRWPQVRHVVDLVLVQAHAFDQVDLDFIAGCNAADKVAAAQPLVLRCGKKRRNIIAGVGIFGGEEGVVIVQLADCGAIGQCGPLRGIRAIDAEDGGTALIHRMGFCHHPRGGDGATGNGGHSYGGVIDDAVDDHLGGFFRDLYGVRGHLGHLVRQVLLVGEVLGGFMSAYLMVFHWLRPPSSRMRCTSQ